MAYKINNILLSAYGIIPGRVKGEGIAIKGIFDMPKRIGDISHDWAEADSVEVYVADVDEINLGGRDIIFTGIIQGAESAIETNINSLKTDIDAFVDVVPIETLYGNACVIVKNIHVVRHKGLAVLKITYREPEVGATCAVNSPDTVYNSAEYSENADKNDCDDGYHGSTESLTSIAGKFTSTLSQAAADLLAVNWVQANKQAYANTNGTCIIDPLRYWSAEITGELQRNNCSTGFIGSMVSYTVPYQAYNSFVNQVTADALAQADYDAVMTQAYANEEGTCMLELVSSFILISNEVFQIGTDEQHRIMIYKVGVTIKENSIFSLVIFGVTVTYTAAITDTPLIVVTALKNAIEAKTTGDWDAFDMAPHPSTTYYPPEVLIVGNNRIQLTMNYPNEFNGSVDNNV